MIEEKKGRNLTPAFLFIIIMGVVSMMSDMTHEGAKSVYGSFLSLVGASAQVISLVSGLGEFIGCSLILLTSYIENKTKKFWLSTFIGYAINVIAIPALALTSTNGWVYAIILILMERVGRAIRKPAKNTLVSFAGKDVGAGKAFAIQEFLDQIGAFIGPLILTLTLSLKGSSGDYEGYKTSFAVLGIPALLTLVILTIAAIKYPHPDQQFELPAKKEEVKPEGKYKPSLTFIFYIIAISLSAMGFIDFPVITLYINSLGLVTTEALPLFYSLAMLTDAFAALIFGFLFDKIGIKTLVISSIFSLSFSLFIFLKGSLPLIIIGCALWGIGMGAQESILKSAVAVLVPKDRRALGFGIFEFAFGLFWFVGSYFVGLLYESSFIWLTIFSTGLETLAIPFYFLAAKHEKNDKNSKMA